jgi:proline dehydrogenase
MKSHAIVLAFVALAVSTPLEAQSAKLHRGAKVFVASMPDFDTYFTSALREKQVPLQVVASRDEAEFEIQGTSESQKAGAAKKLLMGSWHSDEQASISVTDVKSGEVVFAYSANKKNSAHGKQTSAEACAKHLKEAIEKSK